ncbi:sigma-54-dependent transcriptional regulator [Candidatus Eisenbacteria bacterium]|uniref:Sigma-54-dependent transcriptional regulator n=1 Tax=Eiseniibacteriota bacterium TaxID=2212470 RepID=A0ABV6YQ42_UNCEI
MSKKILIIDDRPEWIHKCAELFRESGYEVETLRDPLKALETFIRVKPDGVLLDIRMPDKDGFEVLKEIRKRDKHVGIVMLSAYGEADTVVKAMKLGADYFVEKSSDPRKVLIVVEKELKHKAMELELVNLKSETDPAPSTLDDIIGESEAIMWVKRLIEEAAKDDETVLITGETGVGKDLAASAIHNASARRAKPFHNMRCPSIPSHLFETAVFGHEKGAFTGADSLKKGILENVEGGTVFLNEFVKIPTYVQATLLGLLDGGDFSRVGSASKVLRSNVRFIAATNKKIREVLDTGELMEDLLYRLHHHRIQIPPLRERVKDIMPLAKHFIDLEARKRGRPVVEISDKSRDILMDYSWPGNIRQLRQLMVNVVQAGSEEPIRGYAFLEDPDGLYVRGHRPGKLKEDLKRDKKDIEKHKIVQALRRFEGNRTKAAAHLGISYRTLMYRMKEYKLRELY